MKSQLKQKIKMSLIQLSSLKNQYERYSALAKESIQINYSAVIASIKARINQSEQEIKILEDEYNKPNKNYLKVKLEIKRTLLQSASANDRRKIAKEIEALEAEYRQAEEKPVNKIFKPSEKLSAAEYRSQE